MGNASVDVCGDAVPIVERLAAQPVVVALPVGAVGGVVERDEGRLFGG